MSTFENPEIQEFKKKEHEGAEKFKKDFNDAIIITLISSLILFFVLIIFKVIK